MPPGKRQSEFGKGVIESAKADDELRGRVGGSAIELIIGAIVGSGFLTCGFVEMFEGFSK